MKLQLSYRRGSTRGGGGSSPHVLVVDDFYNRTGHLPAVHIDPLQQRLQPAHVTLNVGVEEGEHLACSTATVVSASRAAAHWWIHDALHYCPYTDYKLPRLKVPFDPCHPSLLLLLLLACSYCSCSEPVKSASQQTLTDSSA